MTGSQLRLARLAYQRAEQPHKRGDAMKPSHRPLPPRRHFLRRLIRNALVMSVFITISLAIGAMGYHWFAGLPWLDSTLNASMILTGMGPIAPLETRAAKLFGIGYSLFSGVAFLTAVVILIGPVVQRFLHRFHLELYEEGRE